MFLSCNLFRNIFQRGIASLFNSLWTYFYWLYLQLFHDRNLKTSLLKHGWLKFRTQCIKNVSFIFNHVWQLTLNMFAQKWSGFPNKRNVDTKTFLLPFVLWLVNEVISATRLNKNVSRVSSSKDNWSQINILTINPDVILILHSYY